MSYFGGTLLSTSYSTGGGFSSSRYDPYASSYSSSYGAAGSSSSNYGSGAGGGGSSAIDRYYTYLNELSYGGSSSSSSNYGSNLGSSRLTSSNSYSSSSGSGSGASDLLSSRRSYRYTSDPLASERNSTSGYSSISSSRASSSYTPSLYSDYSSSRYSSNYTNDLSRHTIAKAPAYDKYGKELSNYDRWRLSNGELLDGYTDKSNNNNSSVDSVVKTRRRISRMEDSNPEPLTNGLSRDFDFDSILNSSSTTSSAAIKADPNPIAAPVLPGTGREMSIMPGESVNAVPSRFATLSLNSNKNEITGGRTNRGRSCAPVTGSSGGLLSTTTGSSASSNWTPSSSGFRSSGNTRTVHSFPLSVSSKLAGYDVQDVKGDGGCYYRCLSLYFTGAEENYNKYRREVVAYIKDHQDNYSSMIKSEVGYASTNDYFNRKLRTDRQEFAETTEIIATCCLYNINIHVLALVPGKRTWEWLHFDPSIGSGKPSHASRDIYLYNQGSVHFMLCSPK